jgi:porin
MTVLRLFRDLFRLHRASRWLAAGLLALPLGAALAGEAAAPDADGPWQWSGIYKLDLLHVDAPSLNTGIGNLGLRADADAEALFGWDDTRLHAELLWNHGGRPNVQVGTTQGLSDLEVAQGSARLYAAWIERQFASNGTRLLFGLYDLNSEFYATDASALLIHPSFGIGPDFAQSGRNGPSIFPNLGLALRLRQALGESHYLQVAVIDGVPGDPAHPERTTVRLSRNDGALLVAEAGWQEPGADETGPGHWGVGVWHYTRATERLDGGAPERNQGAYALAQAALWGADAQRVTGFARVGVANRAVNAVDLAFDAGLLAPRPLGDRGPDAATLGVAVARFGAAQRAAQAAEGQRIAGNETALEVGARWQVRPDLALQPLLQRVWRPGGHEGAAVNVAGLRAEWTFGPGTR